MLKPVARELLACLLTVQTDGPTSLCTGICYNVEEVYWRRDHGTGVVATLNEVDNALQELFFTFGLDPSYPVRDSSGQSAQALFAQPNLWDVSTEYGRNRWALLDRCIKHLVDLE